MKRLLLVGLLLSSALAHSQTIFMTPAQTGPRGSSLDCTATVQGTNDKTGAWTTTGGTLFGANPSTANEPSTIALYTLTAGTYTVTFTSNANHAMTGTCTITVTASPTPVSTWPRLGGLTPSNISAIQAKAISGNKIYNSGEYALGSTDYSGWNAVWSTGCTGGTGQPSSDQTQGYTENSTWIMSNIAVTDPSDVSHAWGCLTSDLVRYMMAYWLMPLNTMYSPSTLASRQVDANYGVTGNRGMDGTPGFTLPIDWLRAAGWLKDGSGATMTATLSGSTMNTPTISAGGTGYLTSNYVYWYAPVGSSGCTSIGLYGNGLAGSGTSTNAVPMAAMGVVQTNSSGVVAGTVTVLNNAVGCTSAPSIVVKSDLQLARDYFSMAGQQIVAVHLTSGAANASGAYNSSAQFNTSSPGDFTGQRAMGNNYAHRKLAWLSSFLTFNDTTGDDPLLPNTCSATRYQVCSDGTAGSLHAYVQSYLFGGMLYKMYAHIEDPVVAWKALNNQYGNLPSQPMCEDQAGPTTTPPVVSCFGDGRDGESSEGNWYQYSMYADQLAQINIDGAGYNDPTLYGPQVNFGLSSFYDLHDNLDLGLLMYYYNSQARWSYINWGDSLSLDRLPSDFGTEAWQLVLNQLTGRSANNPKLEWGPLYSTVGGLADFYINLNNANGFVNAVPLFEALPSGDPTASPPADPRPSLPTDTFSGNNQHILVRSGWTGSNGPESPSDSGATPVTQVVFSAYGQNTRIDHEHEWAGGYLVLSNGEKITAPRMVGNDYNVYLATPEMTNGLSVGANQSQTVCTYIGGCFVGNATSGVGDWKAMAFPANYIVGNGGVLYRSTTATVAGDVPGSAPDWTTSGISTPGSGQLWHGQQGGTVVMNHSELPAYVAFDMDMTPLYSGSSVPYVGWGTINGVTAASRSLLWLRASNQVITYDRAASGGVSTRDWQWTTGPITVTSNAAKWSTRSGTQDAYWTELLPAGVLPVDRGQYFTVGNGSSGVGNYGSDWEPYSHIMEDAGTVASTQFLNVLNWGATGFSKPSTTLVQSSAGQNFDCALVAASQACFFRSWPASFTGTTIPVSGAVTMYVSDLTPNTTFSVSGAGAPSSVTTDNAGVATLTTTGSGSVVIGSGSPPPPAAPTQLQGVTCQGCQIQ